MVATVKSFKADVSCVSPSSRNTACEKVLHSPRDHCKSFCFLRCALVEKLYIYIFHAFLHVRFSPLSRCYTFTILLAQRESIFRVGK